MTKNVHKGRLVGFMENSSNKRLYWDLNPDGEVMRLIREIDIAAESVYSKVADNRNTEDDRKHLVLDAVYMMAKWQELVSKMVIEEV